MTRALTDEMKSWAAPRRARTIQMNARQARAFAALGSGDIEEAYQQVAAEDSERGSERARRSGTHASPPLSTPGEGGLGRDTRTHGSFG